MREGRWIYSEHMNMGLITAGCGRVHTIRIWSFLTLLAIASSWESWLNRNEVIDVVRLPRDLSALGRSMLLDAATSEPYTWTKPTFDLKRDL